MARRSRSLIILVATLVASLVILQLLISRRILSLNHSSDSSEVRLVTLVTQDGLPQLRQMHTRLRDLSLAVYGVNLRRSQMKEIVAWRDVLFYDVFQLEHETNWQYEELLGFVSSPDAHEGHLNSGNFGHTHGYMAAKWYHLWHLVCMNHAVETFGRVLFVDPRLDVAVSTSALAARLDSVGHALFAPTKLAGFAFHENEEHAHCWYRLAGFVAGSPAHRGVLAPLAQCVLDRACYDTLWDMYRQGGFELPGTGKGTPYECLDLRENDDLVVVAASSVATPQPQIHTAVQTIDRLAPAPSENNAQPVIALIVPVTTRGSEARDLSELPLFSIFLSSFRDTIPPGNGECKIDLYLGYDEGDKYLDGIENQERLTAAVELALDGWPVGIRMLRLVGMVGAPARIWNVLAKLAYEDGCDYFYQLNDDTLFQSPNWHIAFVSALRSRQWRPNFGATGPTDEGNTRLMTQSFVHRTHLEIFGFYYPPVLKNWYSDDWLSLVYQNSTAAVCGQTVKNMNPGGTRYTPSTEQETVLLDTVREGCEVLVRWWETQDVVWDCAAQKTETSGVECVVVS